MGRFPGVLAGLIVTLFLSGGCASPPAQSAMGLMRRIAFLKPVKSDESKTAEEKTKLAKNNPLKRAGDSESGDQNAKGGLRTVSSETKADQQQNPAHDTALLALIERELKDETPEEQQKLFNEWKGLDPALVRELVRLHRVRRRMTQTASLQQASLANRNQTVGYLNHPGTYQAGIPAMITFPGAGHGADIRYSAQASVPSTPPAFAGLGTNPWNTRYQPAVAQPAYQGVQTPMNPGYQNPPPQYAQNNSSQLQRNQPATGHRTQPAGFTGRYPSPQPTGQVIAAPARNGYGVPTGNPQNPRIYPGAASAQQQLPSIHPAGTRQPARYAAFGDPSMGMTSQSIGILNSGSPNNRMGTAPQSYTNQQAIPTFPTGGAIPTGVPGAVDPYRTALNQNLANAGNAWNGDLQQLVSSVQDSLSKIQMGTTEADKKIYIERHVFLRMLYLMSGQQERALQPIPGLASADQEFWQQVFWGIANYFSYEAMPDASDRATQTIAQLRLAIQKLQEEARLELRNVVFARNIASFGNYTGFERDEFSPGQPVLVYAEVSNFKSESTADGQYRTILRSTIEIMTPDGGVVQKMTFPATEDMCRNYRGDYFHSYEFSVPERSSLGPHVLKLTVEDQLKNKVATYTRNFTVR